MSLLKQLVKEAVDDTEQDVADRILYHLTEVYRDFMRSDVDWISSDQKQTIRYIYEAMRDYLMAGDLRGFEKYYDEKLREASDLFTEFINLLFIQAINLWSRSSSEYTWEDFVAAVDPHEVYWKHGRDPDHKKKDFMSALYKDPNLKEEELYPSEQDICDKIRSHMDEQFDKLSDEVARKILQYYIRYKDILFRGSLEELDRQQMRILFKANKDGNFDEYFDFMSNVFTSISGEKEASWEDMVDTVDPEYRYLNKNSIPTKNKTSFLNFMYKPKED
jgi:hypothetical protein